MNAVMLRGLVLYIPAQALGCAGFDCGRGRFDLEGERGGDDWRDSCVLAILSLELAVGCKIGEPHVKLHVNETPCGRRITKCTTASAFPGVLVRGRYPDSRHLPQ